MKVQFLQNTPWDQMNLSGLITEHDLGVTGRNVAEPS